MAIAFESDKRKVPFVAIKEVFRENANVHIQQGSGNGGEIHITRTDDVSKVFVCFVSTGDFVSGYTFCDEVQVFNEENKNYTTVAISVYSSIAREPITVEITGFIIE